MMDEALIAGYAKPSLPVRLRVYHMAQDDPAKCTGSKLCRLGLAKELHRASMIPARSIVLNPFARRVITRLEAEIVKRFGIAVIDCSWEKADEVFKARFKGLNRRLPLLLAANPVNYGALGKLSSAEALAASLHVAGLKDEARRILSCFKWGITFLTLNHDPLEDYSAADSEEEILRLEREYFTRTG